MECQPQNPGLSLESQPQNPESRNDLVNFHPCINNYTLYAEKIFSVNTAITRILLTLIWHQILPHDIHLKQDNSLSNWPAHLINSVLVIARSINPRPHYQPENFNCSRTDNG